MLALCLKSVVLGSPDVLAAANARASADEQILDILWLGDAVK